MGCSASTAFSDFDRAGQSTSRVQQHFVQHAGGKRRRASTSSWTPRRKQQSRHVRRFTEVSLSTNEPGERHPLTQALSAGKLRVELALLELLSIVGCMCLVLGQSVALWLLQLLVLPLTAQSEHYGVRCNNS
jgi:hypothetical protein